MIGVLVGLVLKSRLGWRLADATVLGIARFRRMDAIEALGGNSVRATPQAE